MKKRYLFILFLFFLGIYLLTQFSTQTSATQFHTSLFQLDTTQVNQIIITPSSSASKSIQLSRLPQGWQVTYGEVTTRALTETVNDLLIALQAVQTIRVATNQPVQWEKFGVGEGALHVQIIRQDESEESVLIGGRKNRSLKQRDTTFARLPNENEVYALNDFNRQIFARPFAQYRQKGIIQILDNQIVNQLELIGKDTLQRVENVWKNQNEVQIDSTRISNYLSQLKYIEAEHFADDFDETQTDHLPVQQLIIRGDNITSTIQIWAYYDSTATRPFILSSSQFPNSFYTSDSSGIYRQLFGIFE